jgi:PII-like signaling protein
MTEGLPILVIIIDVEERIRAFLPQLDEIIAEGAVLVDEVEVVRTRGQQRV